MHICGASSNKSARKTLNQGYLHDINNVRKKHKMYVISCFQITQSQAILKSEALEAREKQNLLATHHLMLPKRKRWKRTRSLAFFVQNLGVIAAMVTHIRHIYVGFQLSCSTEYMNPQTILLSPPKKQSEQQQRQIGKRNYNTKPPTK